MKHLLAIEQLSPRGDRGDPRPRRELRRGRPPRHQESADPARPHRRHPLLRVEHPHQHLLRAGREAALRRPRLGQGRRLLGRQGRVAEGHGRDPLRLRPGGDRDPPPLRRRRPDGRRVDRGRGRQRRRRQARAPEPGPARRLHPAPPPRLAGGQADLDRRRRPPQPRRPLQPDRLPADGRRGHRLRPADPDPARDRGARLRGLPLARSARRGRGRLRAADAAGADERELRPLAARVRGPFQIDSAPARPAPAADAPGPGQPRRRALRRGDRLAAVADRRAGRGRPGRADGDPLRAAGRRRAPGAAGRGRGRRRGRPRSGSRREPRPTTLDVRPGEGANLVLRRATVLDPVAGIDGVHDVVIRDGRDRRAGRAGRGRPPTGPRWSRPRACTPSRPSSTPTSTCAPPATSTRRTSRPAPAPPPPAATAGSWRWPTPSRRSRPPPTSPPCASRPAPAPRSRSASWPRSPAAWRARS